MKELKVDEGERLLRIITLYNWILLVSLTVGALLIVGRSFGAGVFAGGLIVSTNFYFLHRTLKTALNPMRLLSPGVIMGKYYVRFLISAVVIYVLISEHYVDPLGLLLGLSIILISIPIGVFRR